MKRSKTEDQKLCERLRYNVDLRREAFAAILNHSLDQDEFELADDADPKLELDDAYVVLTLGDVEASMQVHSLRELLEDDE